MRTALLRRLLRVGIVMAVGAVMLGAAVGVSAAPRDHGPQRDDHQNASDQVGNPGGSWFSWVWGNDNRGDRPGWGWGDTNHRHFGPPGRGDDRGERPGMRIPRVGPFSFRASNAPATHFVVLAPRSVVNGSAFSFRVIALDQSNNRTTAYTGTVHFTSSDGSAALPGDTTLTSGRGAFSATLKTNGNQTITATDTGNNSITGTSGNISVSPAGVHFVVSAQSSTTAGSSFSFTVTAQDQNNNTVTSFGDTIRFVSSDGNASLPGNVTLSNGTGSFAATLKTAGNQTITAIDTANNSVTGSSGTISVAPTSATHLGVSVQQGNITSGNPFNITVMALDQFNNTATSTDTIHFTTSDGSASIPGDTALSNGTATVSFTLKTTGNQTITATDSSNGSVTAATVQVYVNP